MPQTQHSPQTSNKRPAPLPFSHAARRLPHIRPPARKHFSKNRRCSGTALNPRRSPPTPFQRRPPRIPGRYSPLRSPLPWNRAPPIRSLQGPVPSNPPRSTAPATPTRTSPTTSPPPQSLTAPRLTSVRPIRPYKIFLRAPPKLPHSRSMPVYIGSPRSHSPHSQAGTLHGITFSRSLRPPSPFLRHIGPNVPLPEPRCLPSLFPQSFLSP
jgi:hypothetical protein